MPDPAPALPRSTAPAVPAASPASAAAKPGQRPLPTVAPKAAAPPVRPGAPAVRPASPSLAAARPTGATVPKPPAAPSPPTAPAAAPVDAAETWRRLFNDWPASIPTRGIVVNSLNESLPFKGFLLKGETLLLQRTNPDSLGARFLLLPFCEIALVKLTDPLNQDAFDAAGYEGKLAN